MLLFVKSLVNNYLRMAHVVSFEIRVIGLYCWLGKMINVGYTYIKDLADSYVARILLI